MKGLLYLYIPIVILTLSNSEGVAILIHPDCNIDIVKQSTVIDGRIISLTISVNNNTITLLNIHGPNKDDSAPFNILKTFLSDNCSHPVIIGGDFDTVLNPTEDKRNGNLHTHNKKYPCCRSSFSFVCIIIYFVTTVI